MRVYRGMERWEGARERERDREREMRGRGRAKRKGRGIDSGLLVFERP